MTLISATGIAFNLSARGAIDFHRHWRIAEAERLFSRKNYTEARSEFRALADSAVDSEEQAVLRARAAIALGHREGDYDEAVEEAARIANQPVADYALLCLLESQSDWAGITNRFGDATIADWPAIQLRTATGTQDMRVAAVLVRAQAFTRTGAYQRAERDLELAIELCSDSRARIRILGDLADLRRNHLKDAEGAYEANMQLVAGGRGGSLRYMAAIEAAEYLVRQGRHDEVITLIESIDPREMRHVGWQGRILLEMGRLWRAVGRPAEAAEVFQEVMASSTAYTPQHRRTAAIEAAAALSAAGHNREAIAVYQRLLNMPGITNAQREQAETALKQHQGDDQ